MRDKRLCGEADEVSAAKTTQAWIERLPELCQDYESRNINLDELGLFFKAWPEKGLAEETKKSKGGKKLKQRVTVVFCCL